jgi:hypothetical protein
MKRRRKPSNIELKYSMKNQFPAFKDKGEARAELRAYMASRELAIGHQGSTQGTQAHSEAIRAFWERFGRTKNDGSGFDRTEKMNRLKQMAEVVIRYNQQQTLEYRRERFNAAKQSRHLLKGYPDCFVCGDPATERHHIIQLQHGGINSKRNLVSLCHGCHCQIHPWML